MSIHHVKVVEGEDAEMPQQDYGQCKHVFLAFMRSYVRKRDNKEILSLRCTFCKANVTVSADGWSAKRCRAIRAALLQVSAVEAAKQAEVSTDLIYRWRKRLGIKAPRCSCGMPLNHAGGCPARIQKSWASRRKNLNGSKDKRPGGFKGPLDGCSNPIPHSADGCRECRRIRNVIYSKTRGVAQ